MMGCELVGMVQSSAAYTFETAHELREDLIEAYIEVSSMPAATARTQAENIFHVVNHTKWALSDSLTWKEEREAGRSAYKPNEWSTLQVRDFGEGGMTPKTVKAVAAVGFGIFQPFENSESGAKVYDLSSFGTHEAPGWEYSNPRSSGLDDTRPDDVRDEAVQRWRDGETYELPERFSSQFENRRVYPGMDTCEAGC